MTNLVFVVARLLADEHHSSWRRPFHRIPFASHFATDRKLCRYWQQPGGSGGSGKAESDWQRFRNWDGAIAWLQVAATILSEVAALNRQRSHPKLRDEARLILVGAKETGGWPKGEKSDETGGRYRIRILGYSHLDR